MIKAKAFILRNAMQNEQKNVSKSRHFAVKIEDFQFSRLEPGCINSKNNKKIEKYCTASK